MLERLTWFKFLSNSVLNIQSETIEYELVYFQLRPENIRILGHPVIDLFLCFLSVLARDEQSCFRIGDPIFDVFRLLIVNHTSARNYEETFSMRTLHENFPLVQQMEFQNMIQETFLIRKRLLKDMRKWLYNHILPCLDLIDVCESYYDWRRDSKITLKIIS